MLGLIKSFFYKKPNYGSLLDTKYTKLSFDLPENSKIGMIAGNGPFPLMFADRGRKLGHQIFSVCHTGETTKDIENYVEDHKWIRVGELGTIIDSFKSWNVKYACLAGGISRVKSFGDVALDVRGAMLILKLRSTKDDVIMRGIASELLNEGIEVIPCTVFMDEWLTPLGALTSRSPTKEQLNDIQVGVDAIVAMSSQDIGQLVVVREGVVVAVEAAEGTNQTILRGGSLGRNNVVVVKCAKPTQDMRFDVPTVGVNTLEVCHEAGAKVLALEAGRSIIIDINKVIEKANTLDISIIGIKPLVEAIL